MMILFSEFCNIQRRRTQLNVDFGVLITWEFERAY